MLVLSVSKTQPQFTNIKVADIDLDGISIEEGRQVLDEYYHEQIKNGSLIIEIDGTPFSIPYSDIDVKVDMNKTIENLAASLPSSVLEKYFLDSSKINTISPIFTYNSGKLLRRCEELLSHYETESVAEKYWIGNGTLVVTPGSSGLDIDYKILEQDLKDIILSHNKSLKVNINNSSIFIKVFSEPFYKETFNTIITKSSVEYSPDIKGKVKTSIKSLDSVIIEKGQELSLNSLLDFSQFTNDIERDLLNRLATALYQAALPIDGIKVLNRRPALRPVAYTQPGLEAVIDGEEGDLIFKNDTGNTLLLLTETITDSFKLYFVSTGPIKTGTITVEEKDHVPPSVITIVNESLSSGTTRVVSQGIPGFTACVSRTIDGISEEISRDKYLPVSKTVETGSRPEGKGSK